MRRVWSYCDLAKAGIIDPTKAAWTVLQNAASVSGLLLTSEVLVTDQPEKEKKPPRSTPTTNRRTDER